MNMTIGLIGTDNMGLPIGLNLLNDGYNVRVYNRTPEKAKPLINAKAILAKAPEDVCTSRGVVISMLSNDEVLEQLTCTNAFAERLGDGGLHISMSTVSPATSRKIAEHHRRFGVTYIASPVFGRPEAAAARKLWICISGRAEGKERAKPILDKLGQGVFDFGEDAGAANVVKLAGNFLLASTIEALAEAFTLGEKNNIDKSEMFELFTRSLFSCPAYQIYGQKIIESSYDKVGFALSLGLKDIRLALQVADAVAAPMPFASILHDRFLSAKARGYGELDWSAMALAVTEDAGGRSS